MCKNQRKSGGGRSRAVLTEAVLKLLDERDPGSVTVTDIVAAAGVTRPTFYSTFGDLPHAFSDAALSRLEDLFEAADTGEDIATSIFSILVVLERHAEFFFRILHGPGGYVVVDRLITFIAGRLEGVAPIAEHLERGPLPTHATASAIGAGVMWILSDWVERPDRESIDELAEGITTFIVRAVDGGLGEKDTDE